MRASVSWVAEYVDLPENLSARELGDALIRVGLEVERVESAADAISGPVVVGRVVSFEAEPQKNGKVIRWCQVDVGEPEPRGIICGAQNFAAGDLIVASLPGAVLPGGFAISARKTYGHLSDGMICSSRELGIGEDHDGILILPAGSATPGQDALSVLGLRDAVLDIAVTPDRGYCLSVRGLAREASSALGVPFHDIAESVSVPQPDDLGYPVSIEDPQGCDQFAVRVVTGLDRAAASPEFITSRLRSAGMRSVSLAVDITNYVMLETGQPLHAFDRSALSGALVARHARPGEKVTTLDHVVRALDEDDMVVADDTGVLALGGVMGGAATEVGAGTTDLVIEAAHWTATSVSRSIRRHKLPSEAAKRLERGVDPAIAGVALQRCVDLLVEYGSAVAAPGYTVAGGAAALSAIPLRSTHAQELSGMPIEQDTVRRRLREVGCRVQEQNDGSALPAGGAHRADDAASAVLQVTPPTWRPDLTDDVDLIEEVLRLEGYDKIPSVLPTAPAGHGLTADQRRRREVSRALAGSGHLEVLNYPFVSPAVHDIFGLAADDARRNALRLQNPLSDAEPELRTSLLPGLLTTVTRNVGRGNRDLALFEMGLVYFRSAVGEPAPRPGVEHRPLDSELAAIEAALPSQPRHVAVVLAGERTRPGWWGPARAADWSDAIAAARTVARVHRVELEVVQAAIAPWHPGRCAELRVDGRAVGVAGELHPAVIAGLDLPPRTVAMELDLDALPLPAPAQAPTLSTFPPVLLDVALVVGRSVPAAAVLATVRAAAGDLLESVRLFDVYSDEARLGDSRSLAFALQFRAADRTLTTEEVTAVRDEVVRAAEHAHGARLRA